MIQAQMQVADQSRSDKQATLAHRQAMQPYRSLLHLLLLLPTAPTRFNAAMIPALGPPAQEHLYDLARWARPIRALWCQIQRGLHSLPAATPEPVRE
jgi:hypothetical protein